MEQKHKELPTRSGFLPLFLLEGDKKLHASNEMKIRELNKKDILNAFAARLYTTKCILTVLKRGSPPYSLLKKFSTISKRMVKWINRKNTYIWFAIKWGKYTLKCT